MKKPFFVFLLSIILAANLSLHALSLLMAGIHDFPIVLNVDGEKYQSESACLSFYSHVYKESDVVFHFPNNVPFNALFTPYKDPTNNSRASRAAGCPSFSANAGEHVEEQFFLIDCDYLDQILYYAKNKNYELLAKCLKNPKDVKRAEKFIEMLIPESTSICVKIGLDKNMILYMFESKKSKLRADMNYFAFTAGEKRWLWDLNEKSPLTQMLSASVRFAEPKKSEGKKTGLNVKYIDLTNGKNADDPVFKFYQAAQKEFYDMRLEEYAKFMTPKSKEVYAKQFLSLTKDEQKKSLKDYIQWHKLFFGIYDTGKVKVVVFKRVKDGETHEMYDCAYIIETDEGYKLCNFGQPQGPFCDYAIEQAKAAGL